MSVLIVIPVDQHLVARRLDDSLRALRPFPRRSQHHVAGDDDRVVGADRSVPRLKEALVHLGNAVERAAERSGHHVVAQVEVAPQPDRVSVVGLADVGGSEHLRGIEHRPGSAGVEARLPGRVEAAAQLSFVGAVKFLVGHPRLELPCSAFLPAVAGVRSVSVAWVMLRGRFPALTRSATTLDAPTCGRAPARGRVGGDTAGPRTVATAVVPIMTPTRDAATPTRGPSIRLDDGRSRKPLPGVGLRGQRES